MSASVIDALARAFLDVWRLPLHERPVAILSALSAAGYVVEPGWQDIADAPRDGTRILCFAPPSTSEYSDPVWKVDKWRNSGWWEMRPIQPYTKWRHLPAPPAQEPQS